MEQTDVNNKIQLKRNNSTLQHNNSFLKKVYIKITRNPLYVQYFQLFC